MTNLPPPPPSTPSGTQDEAAGFFQALFDVSFTHFVTPKLVKVLYILAMVGIGIYLLFGIAIAVQGPAFLAIATLVLGPVVALFALAMVRLTLELYIATVRMSEDIHKRLPPA